MRVHGQNHDGLSVRSLPVAIRDHVTPHRLSRRGDKTRMPEAESRLYFTWRRRTRRQGV